MCRLLLSRNYANGIYFIYLASLSSALEPTIHKLKTKSKLRACVRATLGKATKQHNKKKNIKCPSLFSSKPLILMSVYKV